MTQKNNHKLRIGMIGAGNIVRTRHLPALKKHPEIEIVAVSNSTYESSEKFCRENVPQATPMRNWPAASCAAAKLHRRISRSGSARALAAADRDQRAERAHARHLCGGFEPLAGRYHRRLCAPENFAAVASRLRSHHSRFAYSAMQ